MLTLVDLGPRPDEAVAAIAMVMDVGPRRAAELVEALPGRGVGAQHGRDAVGLVRFTISPPARGRLMYLPGKIKDLRLAVADRDGFLTALGVPTA